ncbi:MAG: hypothetical protein GDA54_00535 [Alphaproteobacteria bacterium GM7ARS4]|nr:hypothetical protein [Alphaproteobacteria bacterium GM7ARS4]
MDLVDTLISFLFIIFLVVMLLPLSLISVLGAWLIQWSSLLLLRFMPPFFQAWRAFFVTWFVSSILWFYLVRWGIDDVSSLSSWWDGVIVFHESLRSYVAPFVPFAVAVLSYGFLLKDKEGERLGVVRGLGVVVVSQCIMAGVSYGMGWWLQSLLPTESDLGEVTL